MLPKVVIGQDCTGLPPIACVAVVLSRTLRAEPSQRTGVRTTRNWKWLFHVLYLEVYEEFQHLQNTKKRYVIMNNYNFNLSLSRKLIYKTCCRLVSFVARAFLSCKTNKRLLKCYISPIKYNDASSLSTRYSHECASASQSSKACLV